MAERAFRTQTDRNERSGGSLEERNKKERRKERDAVSWWWYERGEHGYGNGTTGASIKWQ
jgi:hypothetical protein